MLWCSEGVFGRDDNTPRLPTSLGNNMPVAFPKSDTQSPMSTNLGLVNLPNQQYRLLAKKGATITIMIVGESGLGKTTFANTLFATSVKTHSDDHLRHEQPVRKTVEIAITRAELEEKGFKLRLNIIDTPGFGDNVNNSNAWEPIVDFIDDQHEAYMQQENQPDRKAKYDMRIHACLYFVRPTGHSLKPLDIEALRALSTRVNVIPVIAKADTLDADEMQLFKEHIRSIFEAQNISVYRPLDLSNGQPLADQLPYSVIGSEKMLQNEQGQEVRGRQYSWGVAEVENEDHCDFKKLRNLLIRTHMLDLVHSTDELHFGAYRSQAITTRQPGEVRNRSQVNPQYKEEEQALRHAFTEQVNVEVSRFNKWEHNLIAERDRLNKDLEDTHAAIRKLQIEVDQLASRG